MMKFLLVHSLHSWGFLGIKLVINKLKLIGQNAPVDFLNFFKCSHGATPGFSIMYFYLNFLLSLVMN